MSVAVYSESGGLPLAWWWVWLSLGGKVVIYDDAVASCDGPELAGTARLFEMPGPTDRVVSRERLGSVSCGSEMRDRWVSVVLSAM